MQTLVSALLAAVLLAAAAAASGQARQEREAATAPGELAAVGQGQRMGRRELQPGAYITPRHRSAVSTWMKKNLARGRCLPGMVRDGKRCRPEAQLPPWKIGAPLPASVQLPAPPRGLLGALPKAPPGNEYLLAGADILLVASASRIVVDAVPANK